ncbi:MAG: rhodanese-like domain-containing protein [Pirellulales bacterium]
MNTVGTDDLRLMVENNQDFELINVLSEEEFQSNHIPDSINIPLSADDFVKKVEQQAGSKERKIVVYCASSSCDASPKAAKKLEEAGFNNVLDYEGGIKAWQESGLTVEAGA